MESRQRAPEESTPPKKARLVALDEDDILESHTPLRLRAEIFRAQHPEEVIVVTNPTTMINSQPSSQEVYSQGSKISESATFDALMTINSEDDITLCNIWVPSSMKKSNVLWPFRRITGCTGLSVETLKQLKELGAIDERGRIKPDSEFGAQILGCKDKWYLARLRGKKCVKFDDVEARNRIAKELERSGKTGKPDRDKLRAAMARAQEMLDNLRARQVQYPDLPQDNSSSSGVEKGKVIPRKNELPKDFEDNVNTKPIHVCFKPGMTISVKFPNVLTSESRIVEITKEMGATGVNYNILLDDDRALLDEALVGAGDNKLMFEFSELKLVSSFECGREGKTKGELYADIAQGEEEETKRLRAMARALRAEDDD